METWVQGAGDTEGLPDLGAPPLKLPWRECTPSGPKTLGVANIALPSPVTAQEAVLSQLSWVPRCGRAVVNL